LEIKYVYQNRLGEQKKVMLLTGALAIAGRDVQAIGYSFFQSAVVRADDFQISCHRQCFTEDYTFFL